MNAAAPPNASTVPPSSRSSGNAPVLNAGSQATAEPSSGHQSSLRSKLVLSLTALFATFLLVAEIVRHLLITPLFVNLENASALRDMRRIKAAIAIESDHLRTIVEQSAALGAPNNLMSTNSLELSTDSDAFHGQISWPIVGVQWTAMVGSDGSWNWLHFDDQIKDLNTDVPDGQQLFPAIVQQVRRQDSTATNGLTCARHRVVYAYAAAPIAAPSDSSQDRVRYHLVIGNAIDQHAVGALKRLTQVDFSIQVYREERTEQSHEIWATDDSLVVVESPLVGSEGEIMANLFVQIPREVMLYSHKTTAIARKIFVLGSVASLLVLLLQLQRIVIGPLARIREHTERIAEQGLDAGTLAIPGNDEISDLVTAFDRMQVHLADTQNRLADASHSAGMSQVADTVIHNVGNVLTNVNSLIETATDRVDGLRVKPLQILASRLRDGQADAALHAATPDYLHKYANSLEEDQTELADLLSTLNDNVQHIHGVIRDQRRHATKTIVRNRFSVTDLIREAVGCCQSRLDRDKITVTMPPASDAAVETDRSLVLQIVINLISNARQAMRESGSVGPTLDIWVEHRQDSAQIHFRDNGCGMEEEVLERIFEAHFTTRSTGSGLGLHFCAITLKRLGGSISVHSDGIDQGSTFVIELPLAKSQANSAKPTANHNLPITHETHAFAMQPVALEARS